VIINRRELQKYFCASDDRRTRIAMCNEHASHVDHQHATIDRRTSRMHRELRTSRDDDHITHRVTRDDHQILTKYFV